MTRHVKFHHDADAAEASILDDVSNVKLGELFDVRESTCVTERGVLLDFKWETLTVDCVLCEVCLWMGDG